VKGGHSGKDKINARAYRIAKKMIARAAALGVSASEAKCGAVLIDSGIRSPGSPEAGRLFSKICLGGAASVTLGLSELGGVVLPSVTVVVNEPVRGCMASQYAGWAIKTEGGEGRKPYFAMGSGPARALCGAEEIFKKIGCEEKSDVAVLALETREYPPDAALEYIAERCGVKPGKLVVLMAPTASVVGCVQVSARIVETGLHKLHELGFDINRVTAGWGVAPIAPVASNDGLAIGWTNDCVLYGGRAWYTVDCEDGEITRVLGSLPSGASSEYGTPFFELFKRCEWDFYRMDPLLFSPAVVCINNVRTGRSYRAGEVNPAILAEMAGGTPRDGL
jgi:methenyltetrahydromethanopterin cyclohydrolase